MEGSPDSEVYEFCRVKKYVLVTFDHEFGFEYLSRKDLEGLIIIRVHPQTAEVLHPVLENFFLKVKRNEISVKGNLVIIDKRKIRIRKVRD